MFKTLNNMQIPINLISLKIFKLTMFTKYLFFQHEQWIIKTLQRHSIFSYLLTLYQAYLLPRNIFYLYILTLYKTNVNALAPPTAKALMVAQCTNCKFF